MPLKPKRPCRYQGCPEHTYDRYCDKHKKIFESEYTKTSRPFKYLYNTSRWKKLRKQFLQEHPFCEECVRFLGGKGAERLPTYSTNN
jgi:5-methylcytosine-specific restriction enzyme A